MLSISNIQKINRQIADELRKVDSILTSHKEKTEALERIDALKKLLYDRPEIKEPSKKRRRPFIRAVLRMSV